MKSRAYWTLAAQAAVTAALLGCNGGSENAATAPPSGDVPPAADPVPAEGAGRALYVDCAAAAPGDGSSQQPFNHLDAVNALRLQPGDQLLFRRGSRCTGMYTATGAGTTDAPVRIGAYGEGALPAIDADGAQPAALQLVDMSHVRVENLELTNRGDDSTQHRGLYIVAESAESADVRVRGLYVHDVEGPTAFSDANKSGGGIVLRVHGGLPARFDGVSIEDSRVEDTARSGIYVVGSDSGTRPDAGTAPWPEASTGIVIRGNTVTRPAGDGIVATGTLGALIEDNVTSGGNLSGHNFLDFSNRNCSAGIWTWNANGTLIQRNEVYGYHFGQSASDGCDGTAFDVDFNQDGIVIQYNYSHDNEGGFILLCSDDQKHRADVRYNLSIDDGHLYSVSPCKVPTIGSFDGLRVYNNTFVAASPNTSAESVPLPLLYAPGDFMFANNIVYATQAGVLPLACGLHCSHNLFRRALPSGAAFVIGDPLFRDATLRGNGRLEIGAGYTLEAGSPALGKGVAIDSGASEDYFGNPVNAGAAPDIGFSQGSP